MSAHQEGSYAQAILKGLQAKPVYGQTVDPVTIRDNRERNRRARKARRVTRARS